jgi:4-amino-4-deoxy-L-arabinose transferase-like glycosyltransferase
VPTLCFILLGSAALVLGMRSPSAALWSGLGGAALGVATLIRPLEGVAFGLPATVWVLARAWREPSARRPLAGFAVGGALTVGALLAWNQAMHGSPTLFGFELQWGPQHRLGFHEAPWGPPHTLLRGLQLLNGYLLGLQILFFDAPAPSVALALGALLLTRRLDALDRYLLAGSALVLLGYLAFWGEGHDLGPRYLIPLAPVVAIWTVRFGRLVAERTGSDLHRRWAHALVVLLLLSGWILGTPNRWFVYRQSDPLRRLDTAVLSLPSAQNALVFLPASWPLQVQARLRATGITRQEAQWLYYRVGLCRLDLALSRLQIDGVSDPAQVMAELRPLAADSAKMVLDPYSGSPGDPYTGLTEADTAAVSVCGVRQYLEEQQGGYMLLTVQAQRGPTWTGEGPIVAQDLHEENRRLLAAYPDRPAYVLRPVRMRGTVRELTLEPLEPDSVERVWSELERLQRKASVLPGRPGASAPAELSPPPRGG